MGIKDKGRSDENGYSDYDKPPEPVEGWSSLRIESGIKVSEFEKDGKIRKSLMIPMKIAKGDQEGITRNVFCNFGYEDKVADIICAAGLEDEFDESFPGEVNLFSEAVIQFCQAKLPEHVLDIEFKKRGDYLNEVGFAPIGKADMEGASSGDAPAETTGQDTEAWK